MVRIAVLHHGWPSSRALARFRAGLLQQHLIDGVNCFVDAVGAEGRWPRLSVLAAQLLQRKPDVLVAIGALAALSAQRATSSVPILHAIVLDASDIGLTAPNVAGVSTFDPEQAMRHLRLLQQLVPDLRRVAFLTDADAPTGRHGLSPLVSELMAAAAQLRLDIEGVALSGVDASIHRAFDTLQRTRPQALVALEVPTVLARLGDVLERAELQGLPTLAPYGWPSSGLLMEGASIHDALDHLAELVARVIRGADLVAAQTNVLRHRRLVLNLARARRIGLPIPAAVLQRASQCVDELVDDAAALSQRADSPDDCWR